MEDLMNTKVCTHCKASKAIDLFSVAKSRKDGRQLWCKACFKEWRDAYRATSEGLAACRAGQSKYDTSTKGRAARARHHANRMKRAHYRLRRHARRAVSAAVERGVLHHPSELSCTDCESFAQDYHHINGYETEHWFEIEPLCKPCYRKHHKAGQPASPLIRVR